MRKKMSYHLSDDELAYISQYVNGELDASDKAAFEQRLATDSIWQQKVLEVKALLIGVREASLADSMEKWQNEITVNSPAKTGMPVRPFDRRWWVAAASAAAIVLLGIGWIWFSNPSDERLYTLYFVPDTGLPVAMSSLDTSRYLFYDGMVSYKEENYIDALAKWASIEQSTDTLQYFSGLAHMGLGQMAPAIEQLLPVSSDRRSAFYKEANWYLALCYLRQGNRKVAGSLLKRIDDDEQAQSLMRKLE